MEAAGKCVALMIHFFSFQNSLFFSFLSDHIWLIAFFCCLTENIEGILTRCAVERGPLIRLTVRLLNLVEYPVIMRFSGILNMHATPRNALCWSTISPLHRERQRSSNEMIRSLYFSVHFFFFSVFSLLSSSQVSTRSLVIPRFTKEAPALFILITELCRYV